MRTSCHHRVESIADVATVIRVDLAMSAVCPLCLLTSAFGCNVSQHQADDRSDKRDWGRPPSHEGSRDEGYVSLICFAQYANRTEGPLITCITDHRIIKGPQ